MFATYAQRLYLGLLRIWMHDIYGMEMYTTVLPP